MDTSIQRLVAKKFITSEQEKAILEHQKMGLFSIRQELLFLVYVAILLFTSGVGILLYDHIDTIGHQALLVVLGLLTSVCLYFCLKKSKGFSRKEVVYEHPLYPYLVLFTAILCCTFIGYFQYNLQVVENNYSVATLLSALVSLAMAYYFDNKSVLLIGITALGSFIGLTVSVKSVFDTNFLESNFWVVAGLSYALLLIVGQIFSEKKGFKVHFSFVLLTVAFHLSAWSSLAGNYQEPYGFLYLLILGLIVFYFYQKSYEYRALSWYVFTLVYGYIGTTILIFRIIDWLQLSDLYFFMTIVTPFYVIASLILFIKMVKTFKHKNYVD